MRIAEFYGYTSQQIDNNETKSNSNVVTLKKLIEKWVETNKGSNQETDEVLFVFGDNACLMRQTAGTTEFEIIPAKKIVVFRDTQFLIENDNECRICGAEYENKREAVLCCTNGDE
ncbi:hypothetical protein [Effusibacillus consociatus]|uniref:Uncharacterized protein n=1 Tax=Effusibacillus consociatus TaxID=1117041 RepID=A0ABV9PYX2_9BACL